MQLHKQRCVGGAALAVAVLAAGCAGKGTGLDANGDPPIPGGSANAPLVADFESIQAHVFTPICSLCHVGANAPHGLRLDAADSYHLLVGVPSDEVPSILRVKPGDPDNSYVIQKLEGHAAVGARMPFGGPYLSSDTVAVIRQWITDGALPASSSASAASFALVTVAPQPGETLRTPPPQIMLAVNHDFDATRVGADSVVLERMDGDGAVRSAGALAGVAVMPSRVEVPAANPKTLLFWPQEALLPGHYRVIVRTAAALALADLEGNPLRPSAAGADANPSDVVVSEFDVAESK
jgi:hypothetical protein